LLGVFLLFLVDSVFLGYFLNTHSPKDSGNNVLIFYGSFLIFCFSICVLVGFYARRLFGSVEYSGVYIAGACRQGIFLSILALGALFFARNDLLNWYNALFLLFAIAFLELFFSSK
jgi:hypothetical protein